MGTSIRRAAVGGGKAVATQQVKNLPHSTMPSIHTERLLPAALPGLLRNSCGQVGPVSHADIVQLCSADEPLALLVRPLDSAAGRNSLVVWLPDIEPVQLFLPADAQPVVENHTSADLRTSRTHLVWRSERAAMEVRLDTWDLTQYIATIDQEFVIVFVGPGQAVVARLCMEPDEAKVFSCDLQAAASSTGPNWKPWRYYSDEVLAKAEGELDEPTSGIFIPKVATLTIRA